MYVLYSVLSADMPPFEPRQSFRDWSIYAAGAVEILKLPLFNSPTLDGYISVPSYSFCFKFSVEFS